MLNADLLESIVETRYLPADNYIVYRTILRGTPKNALPDGP